MGKAGNSQEKDKGRNGEGREWVSQGMGKVDIG